MMQHVGWCRRSRCRRHLSTRQVQKQRDAPALAVQPCLPPWLEGEGGASMLDAVTQSRQAANRHSPGQWDQYSTGNCYATWGRTAVTVATLTPQGWMMVSALCSSRARMAPA